MLFRITKIKQNLWKGLRRENKFMIYIIFIIFIKNNIYNYDILILIT